MPAIRVSITIDASRREVWRFLEDIAGHVDWMADAEAIRFTSPRTRGVGTSFECDTRIGPLRTVDRMTVTEWKAGRRFGVRHSGVVSGEGLFSLRRAPGGRTTVTWREALRFPRWAGGPLGALAARPILRWVWRRNLATLKARVEGRARV